MKAEVRGNHYILLTIKMTLAVYLVGHLLILAHEMAHGITAALLGGYFPFFQIDAEGGRSTFFFALGTPAWKEALALLAGSASNSLISVLALGAVAAGIRNREVRFLTILVGCLSALLGVFGSGLVPPWWSSYKEVGEAFTIFGLSAVTQFLLKSLWLILGMIISFIFFRLLFREFVRFIPLKQYKQRFLLVTAAFALPVMIVMLVLSIIMLASGYGEGVITTSRHLPHVVLLLLSYALLPFAVPSAKQGNELDGFKISRRQLISYVIMAAAFAISQPLVFGNDRINPNGIFLRKPPEVQVSSCNVDLTISQDYTATVRLLMRPFVTQHDFLWNRVRAAEPEDWTYYEKFVKQNLPLLLGTKDFEITNHYADAEAVFFNGTWDKGARIIEVRADLRESDFFSDKNDMNILKVVDFWHGQKVGYIDFIQVKVAGDLQITGVGMNPQSANPPTLRSKRLVRWENTSFTKSFTQGFIAFK